MVEKLKDSSKIISVSTDEDINVIDSNNCDSIPGDSAEITVSPFGLGCFFATRIKDDKGQSALALMQSVGVETNGLDYVMPFHVNDYIVGNGNIHPFICSEKDFNEKYQTVSILLNNDISKPVFHVGDYVMIYDNKMAIMLHEVRNYIHNQTFLVAEPNEKGFEIFVWSCSPDKIRYLNEWEKHFLDMTLTASGYSYDKEHNKVIPLTLKRKLQRLLKSPQDYY